MTFQTMLDDALATGRTSIFIPDDADEMNQAFMSWLIDRYKWFVVPVGVVVMIDTPILQPYQFEF